MFRSRYYHFRTTNLKDMSQFLLFISYKHHYWHTTYELTTQKNNRCLSAGHERPGRDAKANRPARRLMRAGKQRQRAAYEDAY